MGLERINLTIMVCKYLIWRHLRLILVGVLFQFNQQTFWIGLLTRLRGAKIDGFEGPKMLELKINRKRLAKGEERISL